MTHFIGIGGIGMSALAHILLDQGESVSGTDKVLSSVTENLIRRGAKISLHREEAGEDAMEVVYSSSISPTHPERLAAVARGQPLIHRAELLRQLMEEKKRLLVAGTHGKTSTTSLLAHVFSAALYQPSYAIGGIVPTLQGHGFWGKGEHFIAETDESDGSFLKLDPNSAILTNIDFDHMSYWKNKESLINAFKTFGSRAKTLVTCFDDPHLRALNLPSVTYGFEKGAQAQIEGVRQEGGELIFNLLWDGKKYSDITLALFGKHSAQNAAAVFILATLEGLTEEEIRKSFSSYRGVKRRLEIKGEKNGRLFFDDYAHHPTEVLAVTSALKKAYPNRRLIGVFQPHKYSRFKDCWKEFLEAFCHLDHIVVTDVYSAGENPITGIESAKFIDELQHQNKAHVAREALASYLQRIDAQEDLLISLGAGDITGLSEEFFALKVKA